MNTTIDFKTAKTIENMSRKIDGMERAVSAYTARRRAAGRRAFIDGPHFELA